MNTFNKFTFASTLGLLAMLAYAVPSVAAAPDISGTYKCSYHDPSSTPNDGTESIVLKKTGDTYMVKMISNGNTIPYDFGTGVFSKDMDDTFSYVYWNLKDPSGNFGSQLFIIKSDGSLDGVFSNNGENKPGTETCTKSS